MNWRDLEGWKNRINKLVIVGLLCVVLVSGCTDNEDNEERAPIEAYLAFDGSEASNYQTYPAKFGILRGHQYTLEFTAETFMSSVEDEMEMNVSLPDEFQIIDGNSEWRGNDEKKTIWITFIPTKNGDYLIEYQAVNLGLFNEATGRNYTAQNKISVYVRDTVSEAKDAVKLPEADQELPVSKGQILNEASSQ